MLWGTYDPEDSDGLFVHACPLGYCRCTYTTIASTAGTRDYDCYHIYDYTDEDGQCQCGRAGKITRPHYTSTDTMHVHCTKLIYNMFFFNLGISILASDQNADFCHFVQDALHFIGRICNIQSINAAKVLKFQNLLMANDPLFRRAQCCQSSEISELLMANDPLF